MADGVPITPGVGATVATDDAGASGQVQIVKLALSADGSATPIAADSNGLDVDVVRAPGTVADGGSLPSVVYIVGGYDGANAQAFATDASGVQQVDILEDPSKAVLDSIKTLLEGTAKVKVTTIEGEPKVKVSALEGEPKVKIAENAALVAGTAEIGKVKVTELPTLAAVTTLSTLTGGGKAHDEADAANPVKVGGRARTALATAVAQDDRADMMTDKHGRQLVTEYPRDQKLEGRLNLTNTTETTILEAAGASTKWVVTGIIVTNSSATVETKVEIKDDTTAKVIVHAGTKGGGAAPPCPPGGFFIGTENKTVKVKAVTTGADVEVFVCGYKVPA